MTNINFSSAVFSRTFLILALVSLLSFTACSGFTKSPSKGNMNRAEYLETGSVTLAQKLPSSSSSKSLGASLIGFLPSVPVGKEFSTSGTVVVKRALPGTKTHSPLIGFFGKSSLGKSSGLKNSNLGLNHGLQKRGYSRAGTLVVSGNLVR